MSNIIHLATSFEMPWDKLIDASLFAFGAVFGMLIVWRTMKGTVDYERKRCDKLEIQADELRKELIESYKDQKP